MTIPRILEKMIAHSQGDLHDIDHLIRVWTYARLIGQLERLDRETQLVLEIAAITHDIACPLCREKYGSTDGKLQEAEGMVLVRDFLADAGLTDLQLSRISFLVGRHHTYTGVSTREWQILLEADFIANAAENGYPKETIQHFLDTTAKTPSGKGLIRSVFFPK